jgi:hypothetical protein
VVVNQAALVVVIRVDIVTKKQVSDAGGGQVYIRTPKGVIRDADTVKPGNESPTRDTKH